MPKILVIGATGYIGRALALSLVRSGAHIVYGLARTPAKALELAALEITPVVGSATDSAAYISLIHSAHIDLVVDAAGAHQHGLNILADIKAAGAERLKSAGGPKLGYVYTSGTWVHGRQEVSGEGVSEVNDSDDIVDSHVPGMLKWRIRIERAVLEAREVLDVGIARAGVVYGGSSWIFDVHFDGLRKAVEGHEDREGGTVQVKADEHTRFGSVHVEDVAAGLQLLVERVVGGGLGQTWPVFDFIGSVESLGTVLVATARAMGWQGKVQFVEPGDDPIAKAFSMEQAISSGRAKAVLGWVPKKPGMLAQIEVYTRAWKAVKDLKVQG